MLKVLSSIIAFIFHAIVAAVMFFAMIIAMNGFNDASSNIGITAYIIVQIAFLILTAILAYFVFGFIENRWKASAVLSFLLSIVFCLIIAFGFSFLAVGLGMAATSIAWEYR